MLQGIKITTLLVMLFPGILFPGMTSIFLLMRLVKLQISWEYFLNLFKVKQILKIKMQLNMTGSGVEFPFSNYNAIKQ